MEKIFFNSFKVRTNCGNCILDRPSNQAIANVALLVANTISGLIMTLLERMPEEGDAAA
tara:strand:- start:886 stop:1062 length:177 start_codon:yes stop_codon:yes gene_type:complete